MLAILSNHVMAFYVVVFTLNLSRNSSTEQQQQQKQGIFSQTPYQHLWQYFNKDFIS